MLIAKYSLKPKYGDIFSLILHSNEFYLLICIDILEEYHRTLSRILGASIPQYIAHDLDRLMNDSRTNSVEYLPSGSNSEPKISDKNDQKFINCANSVVDPTIIVTSNTKDFVTEGSRKHNYITYGKIVVIHPDIWLNEVERKRVCEDLVDFHNRGNS